MESFGTWLARQRELRGLTSAEVAGETRLSPLAIHALENDRFDDLPGRVFVVGYLKAYARCVGLSPDEVVARYDEWGGTALEPEPVVPLPSPPDRRWVVPAGAGALLLVISGIVAWVVWG